MKALQNNFTSPEQSKRLLELGVPADSADLYYTQEEIEGNMYWFDLHVKREYQPHTSLHASIIWGDTLPCWSVGRLMEIITMCHLSRDGRFCYRKDMCESLVETICEFIKYGEMDFSKLED